MYSKPKVIKTIDISKCAEEVMLTNAWGDAWGDSWSDSDCLEDFDDGR